MRRAQPQDTSLEQSTGRFTRWWRLLLELGKFGAVGAVAFVVNWGLFNLLTVIPGAWLSHQPTRARILASLVATVVAWLGNRYWTFRRQRSDRPVKEFVGFALVNLGGIAIEAAVTWFAAWGLGYRSTLATEVAFLIGTALGTIFRYLMYKFAVFAKPLS